MSAFVAVLRWLARLSALVVAGGYFALVVGEIAASHSGGPATLRESAGIILISTTCLGMLVAWRWELAGSALSLAALTAFTLLIKMRHHGVLVVLAVPGFLFLGDWLLRHCLQSVPRSR